MKINLNYFERSARVFLGIFFLFAALVLFHNVWAQLAAAIFGLYCLGEGVLAKCPLALTLGLKTPNDQWKPESLLLIVLSGIQLLLAYEWWSAGWGKLSNPAFVSGMPKTLSNFASQNPFPWYKDFLLAFSSEKASVFGMIVEWSQVAIAVCLALTVVVVVYSKSLAARRAMVLLSILALIGGLLMSTNFYLAAGWTGAGTKTSNILMFWMQGILLYAWIALLLSNQVGVGSKSK